MRLYEIDEQLAAAIEAAFDPETGEILDEDAFGRMNELEMERETKLEGVALWVKDLLAEADAVKAEKDKLAKRERQLKDKADHLKAWLAYGLQGEKLKTPRVVVSWRSSEAVEYDPDKIDVDKMDPDFLKLPPVELNKAAIKAALKEGREVPGFWLEKRQNIQIK